MTRRNSAVPSSSFSELYSEVDAAVERLETRSRRRDEVESIQRQRMEELAASLQNPLSNALLNGGLKGAPSVRCYPEGVAVRLKTDFGELLATERADTMGPEFTPAAAIESLVDQLASKWNRLAPIGTAGTTTVELWRSGHRFLAEPHPAYEAVNLELAPGSTLQMTPSGIPLIRRTEERSTHFITLAVAKGWARIRPETESTAE